jgi:hypothetical protein
LSQDQNADPDQDPDPGTQENADPDPGTPERRIQCGYGYETLLSIDGLERLPVPILGIDLVHVTTGWWPYQWDVPWIFCVHHALFILLLTGTEAWDGFFAHWNQSSLVRYLRILNSFGLLSANYRFAPKICHWAYLAWSFRSINPLRIRHVCPNLICVLAKHAKFHLPYSASTFEYALTYILCELGEYAKFGLAYSPYKTYFIFHTRQVPTNKIVPCTCQCQECHTAVELTIFFH